MTFIKSNKKGPLSYLLAYKEINTKYSKIRLVLSVKMHVLALFIGPILSFLPITFPIISKIYKLFSNQQISLLQHAACITCCPLSILNLDWTSIFMI